jgi:hypothetical protein
VVRPCFKANIIINEDRFVPLNALISFYQFIIRGEELARWFTALYVIKNCIEFPIVYLPLILSAHINASEFGFLCVEDLTTLYTEVLVI